MWTFLRAQFIIIDFKPFINDHVGTNSYGRRAFSYTALTVWNKVPDYVRNAPSVMSFRKQLKTYYFGHLSRPPDG